jgi:hypothetical protein
VLLCLRSPLPDSALAGQEHGRTIPLDGVTGLGQASKPLARFGAMGGALARGYE